MLRLLARCWWWKKPEAEAVVVDEAEAARAARRVAVARDVMEQLKSGCYRFKRGNGYIAPRVGQSHWFYRLSGDLQQHVGEMASRCEVCQLGGLLLSKARLYDAVPLRRGYVFDRGETVAGLLDVFTQEQLGLLEAAFEGGVIGYCGSDAAACAAMNFGRKAASWWGGGARGADACVWACMQNVVANGGTFRPEQAPDLSGFLAGRVLA